MENEHSIVYVDPSGDLRLVAETTHDSTKAKATKTFLVSTKALCLASPVWKTMFDPQGPWARQNDESSKMLEDDPNALLILLDAAHLNFDRVPSSVDEEVLFQLSVLCDKYDAIRLVRPWISDWLKDLPARSEFCDGKHDVRLFISWSFGYADTYNTLSKHLVSTATTDETGQCLYATGRALGNRSPPGAVESIMDSRKNTVEALLQLCTKLVATYIQQSRICQAPESKSIFFPAPDTSACDSMVLGSLIRGLSRFGLWPIPEAGAVTMSVSALSSKLLGITCCQIQSTASRTSLPASSTSTSAQSSKPNNNAGSSLFSQASDRPFGNNGSPSIFGTTRSTQSSGNPVRGSGESTGSLFSIPRPVQTSSALPSQSESTPGGGTSGDNLFERLGKPAHENCDFTPSFRADVQRILDEMQTGVLDEHHTHLIEQERKRSAVLSRAL